MSGDRVLIRKAMLTHPLIAQDEIAGDLLDRMLAGALG
jgi:alpha-galactosidase/6-phospho-beta-glucosidase family protein